MSCFRHLLIALTLLAIQASAGVIMLSTRPSSSSEGGGGDPEPGEGVFFAPNIDTWTGGVTGAGKFDDRNGSPATTIDTTVFRPGHSKSLRIAYTTDEAGDDLIVHGTSVGGQMPATTSLFVRSYERFEGPWEGNWPQGLKTLRIFANPSVSGCASAPADVPYVSEKILFPGYETSPDPRLEDYVTQGSWAYCNRPEIEAAYTSGQAFDNGLPYIRTGHWYKWERWYVMNSGDEVADGIMQIWIDDVLVLDRDDVVFRSSSNGAGSGTQWMSMWFGGNYSNTGTFTAPSTLYRYISDPYLSTTLDR